MIRLTPQGQQALDLVKQKMTGTRNDGKTPAWQHPIDVLKVFCEMIDDVGSWLGEPLVIIEPIILLHDIVEDTDVTLDVVEKDFGFVIRDHVAYLTKPDTCRFGTAELVTYFYKLQELAPATAKAIKCCDRIANLREAEGVFKPYRLERYRFETKMFLVPIANSILDPWGEWLALKLLALSICDSEIARFKSKAEERRYVDQKLLQRRP